jgi:hypothetical protein
MKNILMFLIFLSLGLSCSKDGNDAMDDLIGSWNWIRSSGGIANKISTPESTGDVKKVSISNRFIEWFENGTSVSKVKYTIKTQESLLFNENREMIVTEDIRLLFTVDGNYLMLAGDCPDCGISEYGKE